MPDFKVKRFAGVRNTLPDEQLKPGDLTAAVNVELDNGGRAARRPGYTMLVPGSAHSLYACDDLCLYIAGDGMYVLEADYSTRLVALGLTADPMAYCTVAGRTYHSNGRTTGVYDDGRVRAWGMAVDQIAIAGEALSGVMPAGTYLFTMTWVRDDGMESGTGLVARIDLPEGSALRFTWAMPDDPDVHIGAIYLSAPNGETLYRAILVNLSIGQFDYNDGPRLLPLATQWMDKPPAGQALAHYRGRIYIAAGAFLFATAALGYEWCDLRDFLAFDGSTINVLAAVDNGLFVGTERALYFLAGAAFSEAALNPKIEAACVRGSVVLADGEQATGRAELAGVQVALFTSSAGVLMGMPDGTVVNLTSERYEFATGNRAAALLQHSATRSQYLLAMADDA